LPLNGTVFLNSGDSRSGSVIDVNSQYITVKKGGSRGREAIANVKETGLTQRNQILTVNHCF
jgi:hypothetical protein